MSHHQRLGTTAAIVTTDGRRGRADAGRGHVPTVSSAVRSLAAGGRRPRSSSGRSHPIRPDLSLKASPRGGQGVSRDLLVDVHGLSVLPKIVESGEAPGAVALERSLAGVFPGKGSVLALGGDDDDHRPTGYVVPDARSE